MPLAQLDLAALRRWVITARADLATYAEALNTLNVFPVPDGDTGSNLLMTMSDALDALDEQAPEDIGGATAAMAQATLVSARGNSGVILSQLARGVSEVVERAAAQTLDGQALAEVLCRAAELAQDAVSVPVPGTILTVATAAAESATAADGLDASLSGVVDAAVAGAGEALLRTRDENDVLRRAGVVDAGGAGYLLVIEALQRVVDGAGGLARTSGAEPEWLRLSTAADLGYPCAQEASEGGPAYEVMFLLEGSDADAVATLKKKLDGLGDSLVVAGGPAQYSVHVHVDDVAAAVNAGVEAGRAHRFRISRFADDEPAGQPASVVLALVRGAGMANQLHRSGIATLTEWSDPAVLRDRLGRSRTLLLCGGPRARAAAEQLGSIDDVVRVGENSVQVLAAAAVLAGVTDFAKQCAVAQEAADDVTAARIVGDPGHDALMQQVRELAARVEAPEIVTLVTGPGLPGERVSRLTDAVREELAGLDVIQLDGGDDEATLTIGVE